MLSLAARVARGVGRRVIKTLSETEAREQMRQLEHRMIALQAYSDEVTAKLGELSLQAKEKERRSSRWWLRFVALIYALGALVSPLLASAVGMFTPDVTLLIARNFTVLTANDPVALSTLESHLGARARLLGLGLEYVQASLWLDVIVLSFVAVCVAFSVNAFRMRVRRDAMHTTELVHDMERALEEVATELRSLDFELDVIRDEIVWRDRGGVSVSIVDGPLGVSGRTSDEGA